MESDAPSLTDKPCEVPLCERLYEELDMDTLFEPSALEVRMENLLEVSVVEMVKEGRFGLVGDGCTLDED